MKQIQQSILSSFIILSLILVPFLQYPLPVQAAGSGCIVSEPPSANYTVNLCFTSPVDSSNLTGDALVSVSVSYTGLFPGVQRMVFYLDGVYQLTDYQTPYTFILPTTKWIDGNRTLSVSALMRDGFVSQMATLSVTFLNNITTPPINQNQFTPSGGSSSNVGEPFLVAAAGDGASGEINAGKVADLVNTLNPNLFIYLGDVYEKGTSTEFYNWYGTSSSNFGRFWQITNPTIGNHEYENGAAPGYFDYWNNIPDYYSYNAAGWHFVSLNSNASLIGVTEQSVQYQWLQQDLASNTAACTIVYYHHPLFNIGPEGSTTEMAAMWNLMAQYGVDIVLNGHDHTYQRWKPLDQNGSPSNAGITEFVAGAGGHGLQTIGLSDSRVAYSIDTNPTGFGVLLLQLNQLGANITYHSIDGVVLDSDVIPCVPGGGDIQPPNAPNGITLTSPKATQVDISWAGSTDETGVMMYSIYRNDALLTRVPFFNSTFSDKTAWPGTTYHYTITASDKAGHESTPSDIAWVTTPNMPASLAFNVTEDTYVNEANPSLNYGSAITLRIDASPDVISLMKFGVEGLANTPIKRARLFVFSNTSVSAGINALGITDNSWNELSVTYNNKPELVSLLAASGNIIAGTWVELDVTPYVRGEGIFSFGITTPSTSGLSIPSRESGSNTAYLLLDLSLDGPDTEQPTMPSNLTVTPISLNQINATWGASTDNFAVAGYTLYRDGSVIANLPSSVLSYSDLNVSPLLTYTYSVDAYDLAGYHSDSTPPVSVVIPAIQTSQAIADTYVNADLPTTNFGGSLSMRTDSTPDIHSYLRFNVQNLNGYPITGARVLLYTNSSSSLGINLYSVLDNSWGELTTTYANAPALGNLLGSSGAITANSWKTFDVTNFVTGEGLYSFAINTTSSAALSIASRESGLNAPKLIIDVQVNSADNQAPTKPTGLAVISNLPNQVAFTWENSVDNIGIDGYAIYRDGSLFNNIPGNTLSFTDSSVSSWITYTYSIDAYDLAGNHSPLSDPLVIHTPDYASPSVPAGIALNFTSGNDVQISWSASIDDAGVTDYLIYRDGIYLASVKTPTLTYIDQSVVDGVAYSYVIDAVDGAGNHSGFSNPVSLVVPDMTPPDNPPGLIVTAFSLTEVNLAWQPALDNLGVTGYVIYRDGMFLANLPGSVLSYQDSSLTPGTSYGYGVASLDQAGNQSGFSYVTAVTQNPPTSASFVPTQDTFVNSGSPTRNYGSQSTMQLSASPDRRGYIRFDVQGLYGQVVSKAVLRIYPTNNGNLGIRIYRVGNSNWSELTMNYNNAPPLTTLVASTGSLKSGVWVEIDVTSAITGEGRYDLGINTTNSTSINLASRESGANAPQLVLNLRNPGPDTTAPSIPTGVTALAISPYGVDLSWLASTDSFSVTGYTIYRNDSYLGTVGANLLNFHDNTVVPAATYVYTIDAFDMAGNHSLPSTPASVITPPLPSSVTFTPIADTYVNASKPNSNYGKQTTLKLDVSPDNHGYLRFAVQNLYGLNISKARLLLYIGGATTQGFNVYPVVNNTWGELNLAYNSAPAFGSLIAASGPIVAFGWVTIDVTSYITSEGIFSLGINTLSNSVISINTRESGVTAPQLIVDLK